MTPKFLIATCASQFWERFKLRARAELRNERVEQKIKATDNFPQEIRYNSLSLCDSYEIWQVMRPDDMVK